MGLLLPAAASDVAGSVLSTSSSGCWRVLVAESSMSSSVSVPLVVGGFVSVSVSVLVFSDFTLMPAALLLGKEGFSPEGLVGLMGQLVLVLGTDATLTAVFMTQENTRFDLERQHNKNGWERKTATQRLVSGHDT